MPQVPDDGYPDLATIIDFSRFSFDKNNYRVEERTILEPQLRALGYSNFLWYNGDEDHVVQMYRCVRMKGPDKQFVTFCYG